MTNSKKNCLQNSSNRLASFDLCTGCSACISICPTKAISFSKNEQGFSYPYVNYDLCIDCNICKKTCPILNPKNNTNIIYKEIYASWTKNDEIRFNSSSGGLFSVIASYILKKRRSLRSCLYKGSKTYYN